MAKENGFPQLLDPLGGVWVGFGWGLGTVVCKNQ